MSVQQTTNMCDQETANLCDQETANMCVQETANMYSSQHHASRLEIAQNVSKFLPLEQSRLSEPNTFANRDALAISNTNCDSALHGFTLQPVECMTSPKGTTPNEQGTDKSPRETV